MSKRLRPIAVIALLVMLYALPAASQEPCPRQRLITVTGTAEIKVAPDLAILILGVDSHDRDLAAAKAQNDARVKKALAVAHDAGVDEKDIRTSAITLAPNYSEEKVPKLLGYDASQTIAMTIRDLSKYEALMTNLLQAGINRVDGVQFEVAESRKYKDQARSQAIRAAREKATAMAAELSQMIGKPWEIMEVGSEDIPTMNRGALLGMSMNMRSSNAFMAEQTPLAAGEVSIPASVRVSFQLE